MQPKTLLLDIETTPLISYNWGLYEQNAIKLIQDWYLLCFSYKWLGEKKTYVESLKNGRSSEKQLVQKLHKLYEEADVVICHNGNKFDIKKSNAKFLEYGLVPPSPHQKIDTLLEVRKHFSLTSNKLNDIAQLLGLGSKVKHPGFEMWEGCMRGDEKWFKLMRKYNCLTPDHKVLNTELKWVEIGSLVVGDEILGFDENVPGLQRPRRYRKATVLASERQLQDVFRVKLSNGDEIKCTAEHQWLTANIKNTSFGTTQARGYHWTKTEDLFFNGKTVSGRVMTGGGKQRSSFVVKPLNVTEEIITKDAGWLAGMFDGEGSLSMRKQQSKYTTVGGFMLNICQKYGPELDKILKLINSYSSGRVHTVKYSTMKSCSPLTKLQIMNVTVSGRFCDKIEFLQKVRPERLISKIDFNSLPQVESRGGFCEVVSVEYIGIQEIVALETDTKTYVADGYLMHNCQDVVLLEKVYEKLLPWINRGKAVWDNRKQCPNCMGYDTQRRGFTFNKNGKFQRHQCLDCASNKKPCWFLGSKVVRA